MLPTVPPNWTRLILGVGEAPGKHEDEDSGHQFTGRSGSLLRELFRASGLRGNDVALVNACRCRPRNNDTPTMQQVRHCRPFLLRAITQLQPRWVVAFGATAARALLDRGSASVTDLRGRPVVLRFPGLEIPVKVTYHPAAVIRGATHLKERIVEDLKRVRTTDRRDLVIVSEDPKDKVLSIDTEYGPNHELLTIAVAGAREARVWDVADGGILPGESEVVSGA